MRQWSTPILFPHFIFIDANAKNHIHTDKGARVGSSARAPQHHLIIQQVTTEFVSLPSNLWFAKGFIAQSFWVIHFLNTKITLLFVFIFLPTLRHMKLPWSGIKLAPLCSRGRVLTTGPPGKSWNHSFKLFLCLELQRNLHTKAT